MQVDEEYLSIKRYELHVGYDYYPTPANDDLVMTTDYMHKAEEKVEELRKKYKRSTAGKWYSIYDRASEVEVVYDKL